MLAMADMAPRPRFNPAVAALVMLASAMLFFADGVSGQAPPPPPPLVENSTLTVDFAQPSTCAGDQYWDAANLACTDCPAGFFPNSDSRACETCDGSSGFYYDTVDGFGMTQTWIPASGTTAQCACAPTSTATISATVEWDGLLVKRCIECPAGYTAGSSSSTGEPACIPPTGTVYDTGLNQEQMFNEANALLNTQFSFSAATTATFPDSQDPQNLGNPGPLSNSYAASKYIGSASLGCAAGVNGFSTPADCNAVANLCALSLYDSSRTACQMYNALVNRLANTANNNSVPPSRPNTGPMPWLYYTGSQYIDATNVGLKLQFDGSAIDDSLQPDEQQTISVMTIVLSSYALNGTWLGYTTWTKEFQLCGADKSEADNWINFGWEYSNKCEVDLSDLLMELDASCPDGILYDIFLQNGVDSLYPIPIKITNYNPTGSANIDDPSTDAVRRFFYVDSSTGRQLNRDGTIGPVQVVTYPSSMSLVFTLQSDPRNEMFPPYLLITYNSRATGSAPDVVTPVDFNVLYRNNEQLDDQFWYAWQVTLIVIMTVVAFPMFVWKVWFLSRQRRGSETADQDFLFSSVIAICDIGSWGLTLVLLIVTMYYLILYKLQNSVFYLMIPDNDLENFKITVYLAIVGQSVGILNLIYEQTKLDIFFLDWEKPRKVLTAEASKEEAAPVNCWRTLLIANEFNELSIKRYSNPAFTLLCITFILTGQQVIASGDITPQAEDYVVYQNNVSSIILRFGVEASFFFVLWIGQFVLIRILKWRYISNPVSNFIDLAYLANISIFIFDQRNSGYYIHGRNACQHSDTDLTSLNNELIKEEEGLQGERGLVTTYDGEDADRLNQNQLFTLFITSDMRNTYETKMLRLIAQSMEAVRMRRNYASILVKGPGKTADDARIDSQRELAAVFKQMIDDAQRNYATRVIDPTYFQMLTQLPPLQAAEESVFVHDYLNSFTKTMLIGNDLKCFVFEALFFCTIDTLALNNVPTSAFITYVVSWTLRWVRKHMGKNNLSSKTLVDPHFLI